MTLSLISTTAENEPLIPANTSFILTTNSKYAPDDLGGATTVNMVANDRYFDRPEVEGTGHYSNSTIGESFNVGG